jgi:hypothetical protein
MPSEVDLDGHCAALFIGDKLNSGHGCIVLQMMALRHPAPMFTPLLVRGGRVPVLREPFEGSLYSGRSIARDKLGTDHTARSARGAI